jgi:hypothetical protein
LHNLHKFTLKNPLQSSIISHDLIQNFLLRFWFFASKHLYNSTPWLISLTLALSMYIWRLFFNVFLHIFRYFVNLWRSSCSTMLIEIKKPVPTSSTLSIRC